MAGIFLARETGETCSQCPRMKRDIAVIHGVAALPESKNSRRKHSDHREKTRLGGAHTISVEPGMACELKQFRAWSGFCITKSPDSSQMERLLMSSGIKARIIAILTLGMLCLSVPSSAISTVGAVQGVFARLFAHDGAAITSQLADDSSRESASSDAPMFMAIVALGALIARRRTR
jgi:hypothetical protein